MSTDDLPGTTPAGQHERTWATHLTSLERAVTSAHATLLRAGADEVLLDEGAFVVDARLGPLPQEDVERTRAVLQDLRDLVDALEVARSATARELQLHRRLAAGRPGGTAVYVDGRC